MQPRVLPILASLVLSSLAFASPDGPVGAVEVVITDFHGVEGYTYTYTVSAERLMVSFKDDFGHPSKDLCTTALSPEQRVEWARFIAAFPLDKLEPEYIDPRFDDGLQLTFSVKRGDQAPRVVRLANMYQPDLAALCDRVAALVPAGCVPRPLVLPPR